jgi:hypothetical protein
MFAPAVARSILRVWNLEGSVPLAQILSVGLTIWPSEALMSFLSPASLARQAPIHWKVEDTATGRGRDGLRGKQCAVKPLPMGLTVLPQMLYHDLFKPWKSHKARRSGPRAVDLASFGGRDSAVIGCFVKPCLFVPKL